MDLAQLDKCRICPHLCGVNRNAGYVGRCKARNTVKIALYTTHNFEEPCISGENGSGTIFFSNCNLQCVYCQNYEISQEGRGKGISVQELAQIMIKQQEKKVENINLVTPTSYIPQIKEAIIIAKQNGLRVPILYNTNSYENVESLRLLEGYIDIYLPDLKYYFSKLGKEYSHVDDYFEIATKAIQEMYRQVGTPVLNEKGVMQKGVMIRHLVLPNHSSNSKKVLKWIKENLGESVFVSIMAQYFPTYRAKEFDKLSRRLTQEEYQEIEEYACAIGLTNGYCQGLEEAEEEYVPKWKF